MNCIEGRFRAPGAGPAITVLFSALTIAFGFSTGSRIAYADIVQNDDLIVTFNLCVGNDCANGESFGFDTIRMKENNLRIKALDTSTSASFPTVDWELLFNESANGGLNKFSINSVDNSRTPFTIEYGASSHSLYVDDGGRIGLGTSSPVVEAHMVDGDSPTFRLEQDGSSGFTPQTWDMVGNEANFFIRDVTNGSTLVFRIEPDATRDAIFIKKTGVEFKDDVKLFGDTELNTSALAVLGDMEVGTVAEPQLLTVNGEITVSSDARLKQSVSTIAQALEIIAAIDGKYFQWKSGPSKSVIGKRSGDTSVMGFLAQDIERVVPSLVTESREGYKSVNYLGLIPILVNALKEQTVEVDRQQAQISNQQTQISALQRQLEAQGSVLQELVEEQQP